MLKLTKNKVQITTHQKGTNHLENSSVKVSQYAAIFANKERVKVKYKAILDSIRTTIHFIHIVDKFNKSHYSWNISS